MGKPPKKKQYKATSREGDTTLLNGTKKYSEFIYRKIIVQIKFFTPKDEDISIIAIVYVPKNWKQVRDYSDLSDEAKEELNGVIDHFLNDYRDFGLNESTKELIDNISKCEYIILDNDAIPCSRTGFALALNKKGN